jgi:hypothetical protein
MGHKAVTGTLTGRPDPPRTTQPATAAAARFPGPATGVPPISPRSVSAWTMLSAPSEPRRSSDTRARSRLWSHFLSHSLLSRAVHRRSRAHVRAGHGRWRPVVNGGAQSSKACEGATLPWVQIPPPPPLTRHDTGPWRQRSACPGSFCLSFWPRNGRCARSGRCFLPQGRAVGAHTARALAAAEVPAHPSPTPIAERGRHSRRQTREEPPIWAALERGLFCGRGRA